jgi:hypothetical protein
MEAAGSIPAADNMEAAAADPMLAAGSMPAVVRAADNYNAAGVVVVVVEAVAVIVAASAAGPSSGACRSYCKSVPRIQSVLHNYYSNMFVALIQLPGKFSDRHLLSVFNLYNTIITLNYKCLNNMNFSCQSWTIVIHATGYCTHCIPYKT